MSVNVESVGEPPAINPDGGEMTTEETLKAQQALQQWSLKVTAITNCLKTEHEGKMAIARNLKS